MIRQHNELPYQAYSCAVLGGRSPAKAGSRCKDEHRTT
jgi:hypothetical protein